MTSRGWLNSSGEEFINIEFELGLFDTGRWRWGGKPRSALELDRPELTLT